MSLAKFRVRLWGMGANRGRGSLVGIIDDAKDIGGSEYANDAGEFFMTLPHNHPQISAIDPLETHYEVSRLNALTQAYDPLFVGIIDDFEATRDEVVVYGTDYLGALHTSITPASTSYTGTLIGTIINANITAAIAATNSRVGFLPVGTIDATTKTTTVISSFESRLSFMRSLAEILQGSGTTRPIIQVSRSSPFTITFDKNRGADRSGIRLEYGGAILGFRYGPGYGDLATTIRAIGQKREGATLLYSTQTYAPAATYGLIERPVLYLDVVNQSALDEKALADARRSARIGKSISISLAQDRLVPWDGFDLGDSIRLVIDRGIVNVNALHTVWGLEWIGQRSGSESLFLDILPKDV